MVHRLLLLGAVLLLAATAASMTDAFLKKHAPNLDTHQLALELGSLGAQTSQALTNDVHVHPFDISHGMQQGIEDTIYNSVLCNQRRCGEW
jgi:hypothetical protein